MEIPAFAADRECVRELVHCPEFRDWPLIVAVDSVEKALASEAAFLWTTFTRFEPAADLHAQAIQLKRLHPSFTGPIAIDARMKPWYPKELFCDDKTAKNVDERWTEYFPNRDVSMGSSATAHLEA